MIRHLKLCVSLGCLVLASVGLARSNYEGGFLDSSENLYTASNYPKATSLAVSRRNNLGKTVWAQSISAPSGYEFSQISVVKVDASGNTFVACNILPASGDEQKIGLLRFNSNGGLTRAFYFSPGVHAIELAGMAIDTKGNVFAVAHYAVALGAAFSKSCIVMLNNALTAGNWDSIAAPNLANTVVEDIVADTTGNVYTGAQAFNSGRNNSAVLISKFTASTFTSGPEWNSPTALPSTQTIGAPYGNGCLTLDKADRLTFVVGYDNHAVNGSGKFLVQRSLTNQLNWTRNTGWSGDSLVAAEADSGGNIVALGPISGSSYGVYSWAANGAIAEATTFNNVLVQPQSLTFDAAGNVEVVDTLVSNGGQMTSVQVFNRAFYVQVNYYYQGSGLSDFGKQIFASRNTSGTFYIAGVGKNGAVFEPLAISFQKGVFAWDNYESP